VTKTFGGEVYQLINSKKRMSRNFSMESSLKIGPEGALCLELFIILVSIFVKSQEDLCTR